MFQFPGLALFRVISLQDIRLSHSEIFGLSIVCIYPKLIAAYHVLHRLSMPRHPPYALIRFKYCMIMFLYYVFDCTLFQAWSKQNCFPNMSKNFNPKPLKGINSCCWCYGYEPSALKATSFYIITPVYHSHLIFQKRKKWRISESNRWPPACKAGALASWANPPSVMILSN